jgi:hypothetical protein
MAFTYTKDEETVWGNKRVTMGTFTSAGGSTGGDVYTGLHRVHKFFMSGTGSSVSADFPVSNETFPCADPVTIVTTANAVGQWMAIGD